jgi:ribonuclease T1
VIFPLSSSWQKLLKQIRFVAFFVWLVMSQLNLAHPRGVAIQSLPLAGFPAEVKKTHKLIFLGGPFPYKKDGAVFANREQLLPRKAHGFYREYTVPTSMARDRGAKRIVCGGNLPTKPESCFYTGDHYTTFQHIVH